MISSSTNSPTTLNNFNVSDLESHPLLATIPDTPFPKTLTV